MLQPVSSSTEGVELEPVSYILTTSTPDTTGIVAAITGFLADRGALIREARVRQFSLRRAFKPVRGHATACRVRWSW